MTAFIRPRGRHRLPAWRLTAARFHLLIIAGATLGLIVGGAT